MSGETTSVKQRCAKCGLEIDSFAANPGLWPIWTSAAGDNGETRVYHQQCVLNISELTQLRADNARLKSERDEANLFRERNRISLNRRDADLQAHKAALEKAGDALSKFGGRGLVDVDRVSRHHQRTDTERVEVMSPSETQWQFQATIDWMKSVAKEEMKTVEGCRWLEQNWNIHVEYPPGTPEDLKFFKPPPATKSDVEVQK